MQAIRILRLPAFCGKDFDKSKNKSRTGQVRLINKMSEGAEINFLLLQPVPNTVD